MEITVCAENNINSISELYPLKFYELGRMGVTTLITSKNLPASFCKLFGRFRELDEGEGGI